MARPKKKAAPKKKATRKAAKKKPAPKRKAPAKKAAAQPAGKMSSLREICDQLGVTDRTVRSWIKKGCPCRRVRGRSGGRARIYVYPERVLDWCTANDIEIHQDRGGDEAPMPPAGIAAPEAQQEEAREDIQKRGIVGALNRARALERALYTQVLIALKEQQSADRTRAKMKLWLESSNALRHIEQAVPKILENRAEMIAIETVLAENSKIDRIIKTNLLTLPRKLALKLAPITEPAEVEAILTAEIDDILGNIASGTEV